MRTAEQQLSGSRPRPAAAEAPEGSAQWAPPVRPPATIRVEPVSAEASQKEDEKKGDKKEKKEAKKEGQESKAPKPVRAGVMWGMLGCA